MPRFDPRPPLQQGQLPQVLRRPWQHRGEAVATTKDLDEIGDYLDKMLAALENTRHEFVPKLEIKLDNDQATTTALAAVVWESTVYDNGGWWVIGDPEVLRVPLSGVYTGVFQTKLNGAGSIRIQVSRNGGMNERGMDVVLNGDFTFSFAWQDFYLQGDEVELHVSTSGSRDLLADWTHTSLHHLDYVEAT